MSKFFHDSKYYTMGFPSPATDYLEERIDLIKEIVQNPLSTFYFRNQGLSMAHAFIPPKAILVVDKSINADNGDIVIAVVDGEFVVRYLSKNEYKCTLIAANSKIKDIEITSEIDCVIWGVVTAVVSMTKDLKDVRFGRLQ